METRKALPEYNSYNWSGGQHRCIGRGLADRRSEITIILQIDPMETRPDGVTNSAGCMPRTDADYVEWRNKCKPARLVPRIDLALNEIEGILTRFMVEVKNYNERASINAVRKTLEVIAERGDITEEEIESLDPSVREYLAKHYPGSRESFKPGSVRPELVFEAAKSAVITIEKPARGRPKDSINLAAKNLARDLITVYSGNSFARPSRSVVNQKVHGEIVSRKEGGNFLKFFECMIEALPDDYQDKVTKSRSDLASLIRRTLSGSN